MIWGVSTAAVQIEGTAGRGTSVWDTFCARPGAIADGSDASVACEHFTRYREDVALMAELGVGAYRFSVAWSRVQPDAGAAANLDFYERLLDELAAAGIVAVANLFHWDHPQWIEDAGGWRNRDTTARFADYAGLVAQRLGDRVGWWATMNEPFEHFALGHVLGEHAPGLTLSLEDAAAVAHHLLLGHGRAVAAVRAASDAPIMLINSYAPARPATAADTDIAALYDVLQNRLFTDPVLTGAYPVELAPLLEPFVRAGDLDVIAAPVDALGVNYYSVNAVRAVDGPVPLEVGAPEGYPLTACDWAVAPEGLTETLLGLRERYGDALPPVFVTENGCAYDDVLTEDGSCNDPERVAYLAAHVAAMHSAIAAGVDVRGYFVWSLLDNFEWAQGYTKRFGLAYTDYPTQRRIRKSSFDWYRALIAEEPGSAAESGRELSPRR